MPTGRLDNFDLRIWREGDRYFKEVTASPAGRSERELLNWPFQNPTERYLLVELESAVLKSQQKLRGAPILSPEEKVLRDFGAEVFRAVFREGDKVPPMYERSRAISEQQPDTGMRLNIRIDPPELACLPWEYVFDEAGPPERYLCLNRKSPLVRHFKNAPRKAPSFDGGPIRVLGMIANAGGIWPSLDIDAERLNIEQALGQPGLNVQFSWTRRPTLDSLFKMMQEGPWHIFHFIGHGGTETFQDDSGQPRSEGYIVLDDGAGGQSKVFASQLAEVIGDSEISLAVLNCCDSAQGNTSSSVGAALVEWGIPMAIAMQFAIKNDTASRFSEHFYIALTSGQTVEHSLTIARRSIRLRSDAEWAIPVLFARSGSFALFDAAARVTTPGALAPLGAAPAPPPVPEHITMARATLRELWSKQ